MIVDSSSFFSGLPVPYHTVATSSYLVLLLVPGLLLLCTVVRYLGVLRIGPLYQVLVTTVPGSRYWCSFCCKANWYQVRILLPGMVPYRSIFGNHEVLKVVHYDRKDRKWKWLIYQVLVCRTWYQVRLSVLLPVPSTRYGRLLRYRRVPIIQYHQIPW